jgi:diguanylate cyclase (GGDEF)-like protein
VKDTSGGPSTRSTDHLHALREGFVEHLWRGLVVLALVGAPLSVSRTVSTGWLPLYSFHVGTAAVVLTVFWFRRRLSFALKSALLLLIFWSIGLAGLLTFGILGGSYWWLVLSSLIVSTIYSIRAGVATVLAVTVVIAMIGVGFITGVLQLPADANAYATSRVTWVSMLLTTIATPFVVFQAIAAYQATTLSLLEQVQQQRDRILQLASHDSLTGLPLLDLALDRFAEVLENAERTGTKAAMLFLDLDRFKRVNDTAGHEAGDIVLKTIAHRLKNAVRLADTAARVGGDEFVVVLGGLADEGMAARIAERIIASVARPIPYLNQPLSVGVSIGISVYPDDGCDVQSLRRAADAAMYAAKRHGTNSFAFAEPGQAKRDCAAIAIGA